MKIFCVARNYVAHAKELNNKIPDEPVVFLKPKNALIRQGDPFYYPGFSKKLDYETELVLKICKNGKHINEKFSNDYFKEISIGIDFTARDLQNKCKEKGWPWEVSKSFDMSAACGLFLPKKDFIGFPDLNFSLTQNGKVVQSGNAKDMLFHIEFLIHYISKYFTLNTGDLIYTGTPFGVGQVKVGDVLEGYIEDRKLLNCEVK